MRRRIGIFIALLFTALGASAQNFVIEGIVADSVTREPLVGVAVSVTSFRDTTQKHTGITDANGKFVINNVAQGGYRIKLQYIGYTDKLRPVRLTDNLNLGIVWMTETAINLKGAEIVQELVPMKIKGDTSELNADAYKVNSDASAEDLVKKMPGVTVENGQVKAQGEDVKKVLVDGKEYFGNDPNAALRNLPAEMIDKVQIFDRMSDQSAFTGVDDGNASKTINIITRQDKREGYFGKVFGGYGTNDRYNTGGSLNIMNKGHRLTILGMANNINQQNFSGEDLLGVSGGSGGGGGGMPRGGFAGMSRPGGGNYGGMGGASNFMVGQQNGISATNSFGVNYSGALSKKVAVSGSYFFNNSLTKNTQDLTRTYFLRGDSAQLYTENNKSTSLNFNHRVNLRVEYTIDSFNSFVLTPSLSFQLNNSNNNLHSVNFLQTEQAPLNAQDNRNGANNSGYNFSNDLLYRHRFAKKGRTISFNITTGLNNKNGENALYSLNNYYSPFITQLIDQKSNSTTSGNNLSARVAYTEPLGKKGQLQFTYSPSRNYSKSDKNTFNNIGGEYTALDTSLSNGFSNTYTTQQGGVDYTYTKSEGTSFSVGAEYQNAILAAQQLFPQNNTITKNFSNILPNAQMRIKLTEKSNIRMRYRTRTNAPSVSQLQNLTNNTNPLLLSRGNPDLVQEYNHMLFGRYMFANPLKSRNSFIMIMGQATQNYIGNSTAIAATDTVLDGVHLRKGSQLSKPVNLDGYWNARTYYMQGLPVKIVKSNMNNIMGVSYSRTPSLINGNKNMANSITFTEGLVLSSNISKAIDFTVSYTANYNVVQNSIRPELNNNYFYHVAGAKVNLVNKKGYLLQTEATQTLYSGLTGGFNQNYLLWNAAVGKKFMKNQAGELKLSVFDMLNQNNSISRTVTDTYVEDLHTSVLNRYFMLTFTYTIRHFKPASPTPGEENKK